MAPSTTVLLAAFVALLVVSLGVPSANAARSLGEVEWPCCRQYDTPPTVTSPAEVDVNVVVPEHHEELAVTGVSAETIEGAAAVDGAEPEWPCYRQYEAPPTVADAEANLD